MGQDSTVTIQLKNNSSSTASITATSSKSSDLQVTPSGAQSIAANDTATFTFKSKKKSGSYTVAFSAACGALVVPVTIN